jgi:hypothetical protein
MPTNHLNKAHTLAPTKHPAIVCKVNTLDSTTSEPIVFATTTPQRKGPINSAAAVIAMAVCGRKVRDAIMVATILLASRTPFRRLNNKARPITMINS